MWDDLDTGSRWTIVVILTFMVLLFAFMWYAYADISAWEQACRDRGGVPFTPRSGRLCVDPSMVR